MLITKDAAIKEAMQPETPERLRVKIEKIDRTVMLEDVLSLVFDAAVYNAEKAIDGELVDPGRIVSYLLGVKDAYEAIYGPIIR